MVKFRKQIFYNRKIRDLVKMSFILVILIMLKWKYGFYDDFNVAEITTGFFLTSCLFLSFYEGFILITSFVLYVFLFYGLYTFCGYCLFFYITGFLTIWLKNFFNKRFYFFPFFVFLVVGLTWLWWFPVDLLFTHNLSFAIAAIISGGILNLLEGIINSGAVILLYPVLQQVLKPYIEKKVIIANKTLIKKKQINN